MTYIEANYWWVAEVRRFLRGGRRLLSCVASRLEWVFVDFTHLYYRHTNNFQKPTLSTPLYTTIFHLLLLNTFRASPCRFLALRFTQLP